MKPFKSILLITILISLLGSNSFLSAQADSSKIQKKRFIPLMAGLGVAYGTALIGLNHLWYKDYPKSAFHFFNDNHEWNQMDKLGHGLTSFQESRLGVDLLKWSGVPEKKSIIYGSLAGFLFQTPIEILDGYSAEYGASTGDLIANASGSALVMAQYLAWGELRVHLKYSFHQTSFAKIRPNALGGSLIEQALKDYNGQTYWACTNIHSFLKEESKFPKWLNVAIGYGAENMLYGTLQENKANNYQPYRQYYLSFDIDLQKIKTNRKFFKYLFYTVNLIHLPAPAIEFNKNKIIFHPIYF